MPLLNTYSQSRCIDGLEVRPPTALWADGKRMTSPHSTSQLAQTYTLLHACQTSPCFATRGRRGRRRVVHPEQFRLKRERNVMRVYAPYRSLVLSQQT